MSNPIQVTVVVPVKNEEVMLDACLCRLKRFSEVIVVDSGSEDRTLDIARAHGARILEFRWDGRYPKKRNWVLLNEKLANPWVLFLDADELVSDAFCEAVARAISSNAHVGYWLHYTNYFLGRPLRHGVAQRKLALFKVGAGFYERIEEDSWSRLDMEVHEHPVIEGPVGEIAEKIDHRDDRGVLRFIDRHRDYAQWEAKRAKALEPQLANAASQLTSRQRFKYRRLQSWWFPYAYFCAQYFLKFGFLDGHAGLQYAQLKFWYFSTVRLLLRENASKRVTETRSQERKNDLPGARPLSAGAPGPTPDA
ncbi:MAG: glycosyltransferase family 2 protein [Hyphomonadaceae bacterium]